ncbi:hypothetical protein GCM10010169_12310 [Micromonospora fulviviridis]|uniref:hypothetical protein n=1 Tax=Micromonospora fulviviridis TaxID=47860 RepID=UPI00166D2DB0|nr:hypothetical protein [Micromonospora fulviviridis]GGR70247.1 hypothetical protein GCM10010169_12310 [Micromonospora fulviviridis]
MTDDRPDSAPPRQPAPAPGHRPGPAAAPEWPRQPPPGAVGPRRDGGQRSWPGRHSGSLLTGVTALLLLAFVGVVGGAVLVSMPSAGGRPVVFPTFGPPSGPPSGAPSPTSAASAAPPRASTPFDGTPAAGFPQGQAGIVLPAAKRTGPFTEKQVAAALTKVRTVLVTARLDRRFITDDDPEPLVRQFARDARAGMRKAFASDTFAAYATRFAPGARLTADQPRVKGRISYRSTKDADGIRILAVTTNFVWSYAFATSSTVPGDGLVVVHDTVVWSMPHPDDVESSSKGLWIEDANSYAANIDCAAYEKGLLDLGTHSFDGPGGPDLDAVFDPAATLDLPDTC